MAATGIHRFPDAKVGLAPRTPGPRIAHLADFLDLSAAPRTPESRMWIMYPQDWGMFLNDRIGCCTVATLGHFEQMITADASAGQRVYTATDAEILALYRHSGYDPSQPATDFGWTLEGSLTAYMKEGLGGHKADGIAYVNPRAHQLLKSASNMFGGVALGLNLPVTAYAQYKAGAVWDVVDPSLNGDSTPGSWGGHEALKVGFDPNFVYIITWKSVMRATWRWLDAYCDDSWAILSKEWMKAPGRTVSGFAYQQLKDLIRTKLK